MSKKIDIESLVKSNKKVKKKEFDKARQQINELRKVGVRDSGFNLKLPFERSILSGQLTKLNLELKK